MMPEAIRDPGQAGRGIRRRGRGAFLTEYLVLFALTALAVACGGPPAIPPESPLDLAATHYQRGMQYLENGQEQAAMAAFERAYGLDPDYPGAQVGRALMAALQQDFFLARKEAEKAIHQDNDFVDAHIVKGRVIVMEGMARDYTSKAWLDEAMRAFTRASRLAPHNGAVRYYTGLSYLQAGELAQAREAFTRILALNIGPWIEKAQSQIQRIQQIERATPGSVLGKRIALKDQITRAELAVLLLEELKLAALMQQRRPGTRAPGFRPPGVGETVEKQAKDIQFSWAKGWIEEILALGLAGLELFPDQTFQPDKPLSRANYALVNQSILELITADQTLATRYIGEVSRFPDLRSDFYAYNAIALNIERGIMSVDALSGHFYPDAPVSGTEALVIIRQLQNAVRMEF